MALPTHREHRLDTASRVDAAARILAEHGEFMRTVASLQTQDESQRDDLVQDLFLSLVRNPLPEDVRNVRRYLYRAIVNHAWEAIRRTQRYRTRMRNLASQPTKRINNVAPEDAVIEEDEVASALDLIRRRLEPRESRAITLRYRHDRTIGEIAEEMEINKRSASRYVSVGLSRIRRLLKAGVETLE